MTTRPDQLPSPHGYDPRVVIEHLETRERRLVYPVDAAEFVATGEWRRVTTLTHDPRDGDLPLPPTGAGAAIGEGAASIPPGSGGHARLAERDRIAEAAEYDGKPPVPKADPPA